MAARVIVVGNEKGGSGKSTVAVHLALGLLAAGRSVATVDADVRQQTMTRFFARRAAYAEAHGLALATPAHRVLAAAADGDGQAAEDAVAVTVRAAAAESDVVVIDCPGSDTLLARAAHAAADVLVTPVNDSFVDLDVLVEVGAEDFAAGRPSRYCEMVWEQKKRRAARDRSAIDWIVIRNRLSHLDALNKRRVQAVLDSLGPRVGFRVQPGLAERVIFRELFPRGLSVLDGAATGRRMTMSHVAARDEIRELLGAIFRPRWLPAAPAAVDARPGTSLGGANL